MELVVALRTVGKRSDVKKIRREGNIPAVLYSKGGQGKAIIVDGIAFQKILNSIPKGTLCSKVITLQLDGSPIKAIVKDIQYIITSYQVAHLDFEILDDALPVTLNIPLVCINTALCAGIKLGGFLRQVIHKVKVTCLPAAIPDQFNLDVRDLNLGETRKLEALTIPAGVRLHVNPKEVAVVIARK